MRRLFAACRAVHDKLEAWREQLRRLRAANATVDAAAPEKLSDGDFVVDTELAAALAAEAQARLAAVAAAEERKLAALELAAERLRGECWDAALVKPSTLLALEQYTPVSSLDAAAMAAIGAAGILGPPKVGQVSNYPIMALTAREERRLKKVTFLRRVEQEEWHSRPPTQRGQLVTLYEHTGPVTAGGAATATAAAGGAAGVRVDGNQAPGGSPSPPGSPGGGVARDEGDDEMTFAPVVGCSVENGVTGLLYHELQLHCLTRKVAQAVLMSGAEVAAVHAAFNARFDELHARKEVCLGRIEDDVHRVLEIQAKLEEESLPVGPTHHGWQPIEQPETLLAVADSDVVGITRYVSEEEAEVERLRKEEEAAAEARAAADDARRRALSDMMPGGLVAKMEEVKFQPPAREEWMDVIPRSQLTKAQRLELAEWEARARAVAEEKEAFVRGLEQERKLLEIEVSERTSCQPLSVALGRF